MCGVTRGSAGGLCSMKKVQPCVDLSVMAFLEGIHGVGRVQTPLKLCHGETWVAWSENRARVG